MELVRFWRLFIKCALIIIIRAKLIAKGNNIFIITQRAFELLNVPRSSDFPSD